MVDEFGEAAIRGSEAEEISVVWRATAWASAVLACALPLHRAFRTPLDYYLGGFNCLMAVVMIAALLACSLLGLVYGILSLSLFKLRSFLPFVLASGSLVAWWNIPYRDAFVYTWPIRNQAGFNAAVKAIEASGQKPDSDGNVVLPASFRSLSKGRRVHIAPGEIQFTLVSWGNPRLEYIHSTAVHLPAERRDAASYRSRSDRGAHWTVAVLAEYDDDD